MTDMDHLIDSFLADARVAYWRALDASAKGDTYGRGLYMGVAIGKWNAASMVACRHGGIERVPPNFQSLGKEAAAWSTSAATPRSARPVKR